MQQLNWSISCEEESMLSYDHCACYVPGLWWCPRSRKACVLISLLCYVQNALEACNYWTCLEQYLRWFLSICAFLVRLWSPLSSFGSLRSSWPFRSSSRTKDVFEFMQLNIWLQDRYWESSESNPWRNCSHFLEKCIGTSVFSCTIYSCLDPQRAGIHKS